MAQRFLKPCSPFRHPLAHQLKGLAEDSAVSFDGTSSTDFERFLTVFYPRYGSADLTTASDLKFKVINRSAVKRDLEAIEKGTSVLELAVKWQFEGIQALAIERLAEVASLVDQIRIAQRHHLTDSFHAAHVQICSHHEPPSLDEG
ncbi:hypothetical protein AcV7_002034 [Taiwanofungus camphoratus]|nr:hypothetical protein AcV7_002034 [Antrodia cinnamomea]